MQGVFFHVNILCMSERLNFRQLLREKDSDAVVYIIGICIFFITGITALIIKGIAVRYNINMLTECQFRHLTGLYCPGCGGTRAFIYLIHGNIPMSILYHPLVIYAVILTAFFYMSQTLRFLTHGRVKGVHLKYFYLYIALFLVVVNFIIKNIILITRHVYIIP